MTETNTGRSRPAPQTSLLGPLRQDIDRTRKREGGAVDAGTGKRVGRSGSDGRRLEASCVARGLLRPVIAVGAIDGTGVGSHVGNIPGEGRVCIDRQKRRLQGEGATGCREDTGTGRADLRARTGAGDATRAGVDDAIT